VGLGAGLICAIYPPFILYAVPYLSEALYLPLLAFYISYLIRSTREPTVNDVALAGVAFGLSMLTKETLIAFPLVLPLLLMWARLGLREILRYLLVFTAVVVLVLSPWLARNYHVFGDILYTERTAAIRYQLTGTGYLSPRFEERVEGRESPVSESDRLYSYYQRFGRTSDLWRVGFLLNDPATYARYVFSRLVEFWLHPNGLSSLPEDYVVRIGYVVVHIAMLGLALWQMILDLRRRDGPTGGLVIMLLYVTMVGVFLRRPNPRYNLPFLPIVFIFAARGALGLVSRFVEYRWKQV
jgi:4-amino-4-deoxy-L-arabinose transferase-like glycosyltransferase